MAEPGSRTPAGLQTAVENLVQMEKEPDFGVSGYSGYQISEKLRKELGEKGLKGFKKGGKVGAKGGKVHPGEYVIAAPAAAKLGTKTLNRLNRGATDGLGSGQGGLAIHPSLKAARIHGYEPRHTSKHR